jgi:hypothetical protein
LKEHNRKGVVIITVILDKANVKGGREEVTGGSAAAAAAAAEAAAAAAADAVGVRRQLFKRSANSLPRLCDCARAAVRAFV